jgi:hypothetical protein
MICQECFVRPICLKKMTHIRMNDCHDYSSYMFHRINKCIDEFSTDEVVYLPRSLKINGHTYYVNVLKDNRLPNDSRKYVYLLEKNSRNRLFIKYYLSSIFKIDSRSSLGKSLDVTINDPF